MVLFGSGPIARGGSRDSRGRAKQVLAVNAERPVRDHVFRMRLERGNLFPPSQNGQALNDKWQATTRAKRQRPVRLGQMDARRSQRGPGAGMPLSGQRPEERRAQLPQKVTAGLNLNAVPCPAERLAEVSTILGDCREINAVQESPSRSRCYCKLVLRAARSAPFRSPRDRSSSAWFNLQTQTAF